MTMSLTRLPSDMPVIGIGLEEHITFPSMLEQLPEQYHHRINQSTFRQLSELGPLRLTAMDRCGTYLQVLSWGGAGADKLHGIEAINFAKNVNNMLYRSMKKSPQPQRFRAFAHLPTSVPIAAAQELERCIKHLHFVGVMIVGTQDGKFLDDPMFVPILAKAEELDVPIYLHPAPPPEPVVAAYHYTTPFLDDNKMDTLSRAGWSWHSEVGLHIMRMCYAETFERHPKLKMIIGHVGEMIPMMMFRQDTFDLGLKHPISETLRKHVWVTLSGFFTIPPLKCAIDTFGIDHICWSVDYPYVQYAIDYGKNFIKSMSDMMTTDELHAIMYKNALSIMHL